MTETWAELRFAWAGRYGGKRKRLHALRPGLDLDGSRAYCGVRHTIWQRPDYRLDDFRDGDWRMACPRCLQRLPPLVIAMMMAAPPGGGR